MAETMEHLTSQGSSTMKLGVMYTCKASVAVGDFSDHE